MNEFQHVSMSKILQLRLESLIFVTVFISIQVCGTDNKTYDTSCKLFATKCKLEGTKRGNKLHLDYAGPCKCENWKHFCVGKLFWGKAVALNCTVIVCPALSVIPQCAKNELVQFPLRMRDWLKNVLLQLYEHDSISPGFLTPKQRFRVRNTVFFIVNAST